MSEQTPEERSGLDPDALRAHARAEQLETVLDEMMEERGDLFDRLADE